MDNQREVINRAALQIMNVDVAQLPNFQRVPYICDNSNDGHEFRISVEIGVVDALSERRSVYA
jgi:hypothetical protein